MPFAETFFVVSIHRKICTKFFMTLLFGTVVVVCRVCWLEADEKREGGEINDRSITKGHAGRKNDRKNDRKKKGRGKRRKEGRKEA